MGRKDKKNSTDTIEKRARKRRKPKGGQNTIQNAQRLVKKVGVLNPSVAMLKKTLAGLSRCA